LSWCQSKSARGSHTQDRKTEVVVKWPGHWLAKVQSRSVIYCDAALFRSCVLARSARLSMLLQYGSRRVTVPRTQTLSVVLTWCCIISLGLAPGCSVRLDSSWFHAISASAYRFDMLDVACSLAHSPPHLSDSLLFWPASREQRCAPGVVPL
jgi:hypothetical protein